MVHAVDVEHLDRRQLHELVEMQAHECGPVPELLLEARELGAEGGVSRRGGGRDERDRKQQDCDASHRCDGPASGDR